MDPDIAMYHILMNLNSRKPDREAALQHIRDLAEWNEKGGFLPDFLRKTDLSKNGMSQLLQALENFFA